MSNSEFDPAPVAAQNQDPRATWVVMSRDQYPEGTLGQTYFPEILEGRQRPVGFSPLEVNKRTKTGQLLEDRGIVTLDDLFRMSQTDLEALPKAYQNHVMSELEFNVRNQIDKLAVTPQGRLIGAVFGNYEQGPVPPEDEASLTACVRHQID